MFRSWLKWFGVGDEPQPPAKTSQASPISPTSSPQVKPALSDLEEEDRLLNESGEPLALDAKS